MYKRILFLLDLEGVNNVTGVPYEGLGKETEQWKIAIQQAPLEINAAADALFEAGAEVVALWDNHGGGKNVDVASLDSRITLLDVDNKKPRMSFAAGAFDCVCFFGYHAMEGTLGGVLAHTMNSRMVQYYKVNGRYVGEVDMDAQIALSHGMPSCFFAGGDIACRQAAATVPGIVTVVTKREISRNEAEFRDNDEILREIREKITEAVQKDTRPAQLTWPAKFEKSFKRIEDAAVYLKRVRTAGLEAEHPADDVMGRDAHTVVSTVNNIGEFIKAI